MPPSRKAAGGMLTDAQVAALAAGNREAMGQHQRVLAGEIPAAVSCYVARQR